MARILIVDDSPFILETLKVMLAQQGHDVVGEAINSPEAQEKYQELKPELVALDIMLPGESGLVAWDGRNASGEHVAPGVYYVRATNGRAVSAPGRIVRVR